MKIQAKNIETGMVVRLGAMKMTVESIEKGFQKNGKEIVDITGSVERSMGRGNKPISYRGTERIKVETWVSIS